VTVLEILIALIINSTDEHEEWLGADAWVSCEQVLGDEYKDQDQ